MATVETVATERWEILSQTFPVLIARPMGAALAGTAIAGPFEDGVVAYNRGDYATALRLWRPLAEQGDTKAQFNLGLMYKNGEGVT